MHNHHEKHSHVAIIGIVALVCIVGVVFGSFYYYKHHEPIERPAGVMPSPMVPQMVAQVAAEEEQPVTQIVEHHVEQQPIQKITRIVRYEEPVEEEYVAPRPQPREKRPINVSLNLGFQKVVAPAQNEWCIYEEDGHESCRPCPGQGAGNMRRCKPQQARSGTWTGDHARVVSLMNQFVNQVLDRNNNAARNTLERAKQAVRTMRDSGANLQATNQHGATLYSVVQQVLVAIAGRLPANMQASLNELNSLLR